VASDPIIVDDATCIATSYPAFAHDLRSLGGVVEEPRAGGGPA
jgi:5-enolpyruvylshikimate-3-phosphate synthase